MNELEILAISLSKGYINPILCYLEDCEARDLDDVRILLRGPILYCISEFNEGYSRNNITELNKSILTIKNTYLRSLNI